MEKIIVLALVLVVFIFTTAIATAPNSISVDQTLSIESDVVPSGDPIDGGPPGVLRGDPIDGGPPGKRP